ncbi:GTP cyclohydrolase II RibA [Limoniibacter endophyticus]|uniref:GTP cyclohydrolase-2 n=1 Tax=Limoniibacter endophyticus TaxID=1565040 RepID=A0A8J3GHY9_9HYPH|nr:GTP cyclohydrolase II RibA [Limoniibacter endophyticus]GHC69127.1 GTP cyclohydrolase-2 [Limoniibacter endophyticus]
MATIRGKIAKTSFMTVDPAIRCERASSELRFGRAIVVEDKAQIIAALALDACAPSTFDLFAVASDNMHQLFLSPFRAGALGLETAGGLALPLSGIDFEEASRLSFARDVALPGHFLPATDAMRSASSLAQLSLLLPGVVCADISRSRQLFDGCVSVNVDDVSQAARHAQRFELVVRTMVPLKDFGNCEFFVFRGGIAQRDQIAIVVGKPDSSKPVPVRIHSSCITGDLCGSLKCDCGDQLRNGLAAMYEAGGGIMLYLDQEGRGTGIGAKMRAYGYQHEGLDTIDADAELGFGPDHRKYEAAVAMLSIMGIDKVDLLTNNPTKIAYLRKSGIDVIGRTAVGGVVTAENLNYLRTKSVRAGHMIDIAALERSA